MVNELLKKRIGAAFIDLVTVGALCILVHMPWKILPFPAIISSMLSIMTLLFFGAIILLKDAPYRFEGMGVVLEHQSPGKKAMRIAVTKSDGVNSIDVTASITRNLILALPYFWSAFIVFFHALPLPFPQLRWILISSFALIGFFGMIGILGFEIYNMYKDPDGLRMGDKKAGTRVVEL
ncbi:MAG: RDD family protein [Candidatus Riflebacteria bacterium]|nr:RDD family protein [Candidatus Riflebacteria bacterium]